MATEEQELTLTEDIAQSMFQPDQEPEMVLEEEVAEDPQAEEPVAESTIDIAGREFTKDQLEPFVKVAEWAEANPEVWDQIQALEQSNVPQVEAPEQEWVDPDERLARIEGALQALMQEKQTNSRAEFVASLDDAMSQFQDKHPELDESGVQQVLVKLRDLEILPVYRQKYPARPVAATLEALETAYRVEYFDRAPARQPITTSEARARRRAATSAPVPASAPREPEEPQTKEERQQALVADLKEAMQAN